MKPVAIVTLLLFFGAFQVNGQTSVSNDFEGLASVEKNLLDLNSNDWIFYSGEDDNIMFIDFEKINANLKEVAVRNQNKEVVFEDELWSLPVDSIYELDLSKYPKGFYQVKIKTFTDSIVKNVKVD